MQCEMLWHVESGAFIILAGMTRADTYTIMPQDHNPRPAEDVWLLFKGADIAHPLCGPTSFAECIQTLYNTFAPDALDSHKIAKVEVTGDSPLEMTVTVTPNIQRIDAHVTSDGTANAKADLPDGTTGDVPTSMFRPWPHHDQRPPESND